MCVCGVVWCAWDLHNLLTFSRQGYFRDHCVPFPGWLVYQIEVTYIIFPVKFFRISMIGFSSSNVTSFSLTFIVPTVLFPSVFLPHLNYWDDFQSDPRSNLVLLICNYLKASFYAPEYTCMCTNFLYQIMVSSQCGI